MGTIQIEGIVNLEWHGAEDIDEADSCHMVVDSELFEAVGQGSKPASIRCYTWQKPALTIGRLQNEDAARREFPGLPLYRRPTGGKAVAHGKDLTICLVAAHDAVSKFMATSRVIDTYKALVEPMRRTLALFDLSTNFGSVDASGHIEHNSENCFLTTARCDVVDEHGIKVMGAAMRRSSTAVIVQMSLQPVGGIDVTSVEFGSVLRNSYERFTQSGR